MTPKVIEIASSEIGVKESPPNSNNVKYNTWYYGREVSGGAYPWCMAFVQWCYDKAGYTLPYKTASCSSLLNWYKNNKPDCVVKAPRPGDVIIYNFGHTGIVESVSADTITAIEGNTAVGNDSNGGEVMRRTRSKALVTAYIRPFDFTEEEDMTGKEIYDKLNEYLLDVELPGWAKDEFEVAKAMGITDGSAPMCLIPRYQAAIMAKRAAETAKNDKN